LEYQVFERNLSVDVCLHTLKSLKLSRAKSRESNNGNSIAGQWTEKAQAHEWITNNLTNPRAYLFSIYLMAPSTSQDEHPIFIGSLGSAHDREIGYMFHPDYWGKGYATEALCAFIKVYFEKLPLEEYIVAKTDEGNGGSRRVLEKLGFKEVGREIFQNVTLGPSPSVVYEIRREDVLGKAKEEEEGQR
jgi:ribosomal-protein-alanine N-acetyltransferase